MRNLIVISFLFISSVLYSQNVNWDSLVNFLTQPSLTFSEIDAFLERKKVAGAKRKTIFVDPGFRKVQFDSLIQTTYTIVKIPNKRTRKFSDYLVSLELIII